MTMDKENIRSIVGVMEIAIVSADSFLQFLSARDVFTFSVYSSPAPTMWRIFRNKSVEEFEPDPYIASVMNCLLWIFYGIPINQPDSILVMIISAIGLPMQLIYLSLFLIYGNNTHRKNIIRWIAIELVGFGAIAGFDLGFFHTHASRSNLWESSVCCSVSSCMLPL